MGKHAALPEHLMGVEPLELGAARSFGPASHAAHIVRKLIAIGGSMHIAFVDDSKQSGKRHRMGKLVSLGAAVFAEDKLKPFTDSFYKCYDDLGVPRDVELKWSPGSRNDWFRENEKTELIAPLRRAVLASAAEHEARIFVVSWDLGAATTLRGQPAEKWVIQFLFERVSMMLENLEARGIVVFDKPGGDHRAEDDWLAGTRYLTDLGTEYVRANAVVIPILTAPSHHHPHLQLADLVTGSVTAALCGSKFGMDLIPDLIPMFHSNRWGFIGGTGIKLYPNSLNNLHHWVLGEDTFTRGSGGVALPYSGFARYTENDGLIVAGSELSTNSL